ncbi:MAG: NAD(P)H-dependent oxidoreductase subunit E [Bradyrhizobium sp.]|uniref:NAD(P)H-dependent oxidoreductase subunit E n=1 Tax=Bradyrhizobium sp. TaxID=376 RepID=UPI0025C417BA|nr:NAD(P)H-dependent oxidoreductase subunit E [Bradyrhizobium sp.]MBI5263621.1 NAD(P)H-dependent oxidoreductase subunit E [Bradyrhizobium sp.]
MSDHQEKAVVDAVLDSYGRNDTALVQILIAVQDELDWISPDAVTLIAEGLKVPRPRVEATASFYSFLYTEPRGRYRVLFSDNIIDQMAGSRALYQRMLDRFGCQPDKVSKGGLVSIGLTSCIGMGDQGPAMLVNGRAVPRLTPQRIDRICLLIGRQAPLNEWPAEFFEIDTSIRRPDVLLGLQITPGDALKAAVAKGVQGFIAEMERSNLRGRGGAGFTTAVKWKAARNASGDEKVIICNADEGEPGTFKDRVLLQSYAARVFEGMALAAFAVGARQGFLYLRGEYRYLLASLHHTLDELRAQGLLGQSILGVEGFDFDIEIFLGAGAYICGEETALIESLEGKPGKPRIRPPFPVTHGYLGRPTSVNNVETLCKAVEIALRGGEAYRGTGTRQSTGTKILSISGDCARPGIYEYPFGVRIAQVLEDCGAEDPLAVVIGGASGVCLSDNEFGRRIAFEDVPTAGAFMVFGRERDIVDVAVNFAHFFAHESCGFCTPCRVGTSLVADILDKIDHGHGTRYEINELRLLRQVLSTTSHCGLGQMSMTALGQMLEKFRPAFNRRLKSLDFEPGFDLDQALAISRSITGRDDEGAHLGAEA